MHSLRFFTLFLFLTAAAAASIIKVGDALDIQVLQHPEFSGRYTVNERGTIEYPLLTEEPIANSTTLEVMNDLTFRLARHIDNPLVLISLIDKPEVTMTVLGQVTNPGLITTFEGASIQEVLKASGGPSATSADLSRIKIMHKNSSNPGTIFNLEQFLVNGDVDDLPKLEADDIIIVLAQERTKKIKVIGSVQKPGLFTLEEKMNLFEIIYLAGGPTEKADLTRVRRFTHQDTTTVAEEIFNLQGYIDNGKMNEIPSVSEGDVIIVYSKWFDWKTVLTVLNNTLLFIVTIQAFAGIFK